GGGGVGAGSDGGPVSAHGGAARVVGYGLSLHDALPISFVGGVALVRRDDGVGAHGGGGVADRASLHLAGAGERAAGEGGGGGIREEVDGAGGEGRGGDRVGDGGGAAGGGAGGEGGRVAAHGGDGRVLGDGLGGRDAVRISFVGGVALVRRDDGVGAHGGGGVADRASLHLAGADLRGAAGEGG